MTTQSVLGFPICRSLIEAGELEILIRFLLMFQTSIVFIHCVQPMVAWFQSGLIHLPSAEAIADSGMLPFAKVRDRFLYSYHLSASRT
jgi:hypothetical protein